MSKFALSFGNFDPIPEGTDVVLRIKSVDDSKLETFGKVKVILEDEKGHNHTENFSMYLSDGKTENNAGRWYLTNLYMVALGLDEIEDGEEVDLQNMTGHFIRCDITHEKVESTKKPGTFNTYSRLGKEKFHADGFDGETKSKPAFDLDSLLG